MRKATVSNINFIDIYLLIAFKLRRGKDRVITEDP